MIVHVLQAPVMFVPERIGRRGRIGIANRPEVLDKVVPILIRRQGEEVSPLLIGNQVIDFLV